jgi:hypothetical protein
MQDPTRKPEPGHAPALAWQRVPLHTDLCDPVARLAAVAAWSATYGPADGEGSAPQGQHAAAATLAMSGKMQGLLGLGAGQRAPAASCTITNVAGPDVTLYLNGARMTYFSAIMPISDGMGLVFAVTSYDGRIIVSPTSCRELLPDPEGFTQHLRDAFQDLLARAREPAAGRGRAEQPTIRSAPPRASARGAGSPRRPRAGKAATPPRAARAGRPRSAAPAG